MLLLIKSLLSAFTFFGAGVGVTSLVDKFFPDKLPAGAGPLSNINNPAGKINWLKVVLIVSAGAIGMLIVKFIAKKLNIKFLKN